MMWLFSICLPRWPSSPVDLAMDLAEARIETSRRASNAGLTGKNTSPDGPWCKIQIIANENRLMLHSSK